MSSVTTYVKIKSVHDVMALKSVHDVVALNTYSLLSTPGNLKFNGEFVRQVLGEVFFGGCAKDTLTRDEKA
jgi:hypothetical protein